MTDLDLMAKWEARAEELQHLDAQVNGATICRAFLQDLAKVRATAAEIVLTLAEAAKESGYSQAHLARLVKAGKLRTLRIPGSRGHLSFLRAGLPRKPQGQQIPVAGVHELASRLYGGREAYHGQT